MNKQAFRKVFMRQLAFFVGIPAVVWQVLFFYSPLLFIIGLSFSGFTFSHYLPFFTNVYMYIVVRSLVMAISNAILCALIAYPIAYFLAFKAGRFKLFHLFFLIVPFWTNFLLHIYAWFFVLERDGFLNNLLIKLSLISEPLRMLNTMAAVMVMMVYYYLPFMILPIYTNLERFDRKLLEASLDLGATWWQTVRNVLLPLSLPGIRSGFFLVLVPSFGEFAIPELMGGDKNMFVGSVVSHYILGSQTKSLGAAFTLLSCTALICMVVVVYWLLGKILKPKMEV